jgi:hypothetical protein
MSFLLLLSEDKLEQIVTLLPKYEEKIEKAEKIFQLEGEKLEHIIRTLPSYQATYDQAYQEMRSLEEWVNNIKEKRVAKCWKKYLKGYSKALSTRDIQAYIAGEREIVEMNQIIIEVVLIKNKLLAIVEAIKQLGWMVGHTTKLRISELQDVVL